MSGNMSLRRGVCVMGGHGEKCRNGYLPKNDIV